MFYHVYQYNKNLSLMRKLKAIPNIASLKAIIIMTGYQMEAHNRLSFSTWSLATIVIFVMCIILVLYGTVLTVTTQVLIYDSHMYGIN